MTRPAALCFALSLLASVAHAEPLPFDGTVEIGRPARSVAIHVEAVEDGVTVRAAIGGRDATETVRVDSIGDVTVERVEVAAGHHVAVVRGASTEGPAFAAVVAVAGRAPTIPWAARTDLHGDPGERVAGVIELEDRTGDGHPDVVVGVVREGARLCTGDRTLLQPRAWDPGRGQLRPVVLRRVGASDSDVAVTATRESPGPEGPPLLRALGARGASSRSGYAEDDPGALAPPRPLVDGDLSTFWAEGRGGPGAQEFAAVRWNARFPIRALAVVLTPTGEAGPQLGRPRAFWLAGSDGTRLRVTVPEDPVGEPGARWWIVPPEPLEWECVSLVLDEAYPPRGVRSAAVHTGLAELEVYTELDWGAGVEGLVALLVEGGSGGDEAARLLASLGQPAVTAVAAAWERLDPQGRRRAVRVFSLGARRGADEGAIEALERAGRDEADDVRHAALQALGTHGDEAGAALARLVREPAPVGDDAVTSLLRHDASIAVPGLLGAIAAEGGSERPALREGLARAVARGGDAARTAVLLWTESSPGVPALASAALGLAGHGASRPLVAPILRDLVPRLERFEDRWRAIGAARAVSADPPTDAWLAQIVAQAEEWMLRAAAMDALGRRAAPERAAVARAALGDDYPRVRVEAIRVLDPLDAEDALLTALARRDTWPMVRSAAVEALFDRPAGREAVRRSIRDRSARVRRSAIEASMRAGDAEALPLVIDRLQDDDEWPRVTLAALQFVGELCAVEASDAVIGVLRRGARTGAWAPDVDVAAVAGDLAVRLGGQAAQDAQTIAARAGTPEALRVVIERRVANPRSCRGASSP